MILAIGPKCVGERERFPAPNVHCPAGGKDGLDDPIGRDGRTGIQPERLAQFGDAMDRDFAPEKQATIARRDPADPHVIGRQLVPNRQQQVGGEMDPGPREILGPLPSSVGRFAGQTARRHAFEHRLGLFRI